MTSINWLLTRMSQWSDDPAIVAEDRVYSYRHIADDFDTWRRRLAEDEVYPGKVVALEADYSAGAIALLLVLIYNKNIVVPLQNVTDSGLASYRETAEVNISYTQLHGESFTMERLGTEVRNPVTRRLVDGGDPGLVVFSSGTEGSPKAILHSFPKLLEKFKTQRKRLCTLSFLLFDHLGGINTLLYTLSNGGTLVVARERNPESVCRLVEKYRVQLLPTSPTFCNLLLISDVYKRYDLSSLNSSLMGPRLCLRAHSGAYASCSRMFDYSRRTGLSELGVLRSKSKSSDSLWVKVGGEGFQTKVVDGTLWIRADSAMVGYLNAPDPFDSEGWFNTEDLVEVDEDGEYIRLLGRRSDIINVGGEKVYPAEVESVLQQMPNVRDVVVYGESNSLMGKVPVARINLFESEDSASFTKRMRGYCRQKLTLHKIPVRVELLETDQFNSRYKRLRR